MWSFIEVQSSRLSLIGLPISCLYLLLIYIASEAHEFERDPINRAGFLVVLGALYYAHHRWTFDRSVNPQFHLVRFLTLAMATYVSAYVITFFIVKMMGKDHALALAVIALTVPGVNSIVSKFWTRGCNPSGDIDNRSWTAFGSVASLCVGALVLTWLHRTSFNHDTSWYFVATHLWIEGAPLYSGVMEINPPLLFYLTRAVLGVGALLVWSDEDAMRFALFLLALISILLMNRVLNTPSISSKKRAAMLIFGTVALLVIPLNSFGQREHMFVMFVLPYLTVQAIRQIGNDVALSLRIVCVIFALPGLLLKPYFLLLPAMLSLYETVRLHRLARLPSLENAVIAVASLTYLVLVYTWHSDYFHVVIPFAKLTYFAFGKSIGQIIFDPLLWILLPCCIPLMVRSLPASDRRFAEMLLLASLAFLLMYLIQFKGWNYHAVPYWAAAFLLASWLFVSSIDSRQWIWGLIPFVLILKLVVIAQVDQGPYLSRTTEKLQRTMGNVAGKKAMVFSSNVSHAFPLVNQAKLLWTSRYPTQWIVPGAFVALQSIPVNDNIARAPYEIALGFARRTAAEDFVRHKPHLVVIDVRRVKSYFNGHSFDWIDFLSQDADFSREWAHYYLDKEILNFQIWRLSDQ